MSKRQSWHEVALALVDVAMGRRSADLVIKDGQWVNVHSGEIIPHTDVAILGSRIAYVGPNAEHAIGERTEVVEARGRYLVPGLCDAHMHVESGMITVTEFSRAVIPHGTTSMFIDPHEIANVLGLEGVRLMHDEAATMPINVYVQMPSCVPSAPGLETPGATISQVEVAEAMTWPGIIGLGEMMNFPGVFTNDGMMHAEITEAMKAGKTVGGHYASSDLGLPFHGYAAGGPTDDHEGTRLEDGIARVRQGMRAMLRLGSAWHDVASQIKAITELGLDSRNYILCTDDCHSGTLVHEGHMDRVVRHAIAQGLRPVTAIQMATLNTAEYFGLDKDIGSITPGRYADIVISGDLSTLPIEVVIAGGAIVAEDGELQIDIPPYPYPIFATDTVRVGKSLTALDFDIPAPSTKAVNVRVVGIVENQAPTQSLTRVLPVDKGVVQLDPRLDVAHLALVERHRGTGNVVNGFVAGFGFSFPCGIASTVAHDSHHMVVAGTSKHNMAQAVNRLSETEGGVAVFKDGEEIALVELQIAGLMSTERAEVVAEKAKRMTEAFRECGCEINNAFMQLSLLALVVIPELRISDLGIVDVTKFEIIPLFVD
ncbi:MAG TPA: adenine deaminase [candidate division Zixibacteria bacterium]|nr:adenine deaminase [candidate division Zixibacteria bacterium]